MPPRNQNGSYRELTEDILTYVYVYIYIYVKMVWYTCDIIVTEITEIGKTSEDVIAYSAVISTFDRCSLWMDALQLLQTMEVSNWWIFCVKKSHKGSDVFGKHVYSLDEVLCFLTKAPPDYPLNLRRRQWCCPMISVPWGKRFCFSISMHLWHFSMFRLNFQIWFHPADEFFGKSTCGWLRLQQCHQCLCERRGVATGNVPFRMHADSMLAIDEKIYF